MILIKTVKPYKDIQIKSDYIIREFGEDIDPIELMWHRDNESRTIIPLKENNWLFQIDNQLPIPINKPIHIQKHEWHRVIKGSSNLQLKIYKHKDN